MTDSSKPSNPIKKVLDWGEMLARSRAFSLLRRLEPAFVIFTVFGLVVATVAIMYDLSDRQEQRVSRAWQTASSAAPGNTGKADALKILTAAGEDLR